MNSNYGKSSNKSTNLNSFEFDLGLGTNRSRSLSDQKNKQTSSFSSTQSKPNTTPSWQPNRPAWVHQPLPTQSPSQSGPLSGPTSMVGDIFGKSWGSPAPSSTSSGVIGIANKNPNLFGDLVSSAIGGNKGGGGGNVPLKNATPVSAPPASNKSPFSMGSLADSLPKTGNPVKTSSNWGSSESLGSYSSGYNNSGNNNVNGAKNLGGPSIRNLGGSGAGGINSNKDPFGSFVDFQSKPASGMKTGAKGSNKSSSGDDGFGDFQNAKKTSAPAFPSNASANNSNSMGSNYASYSKMDDFGIPTSQKQPPVHSSGVDAFDVLFSSSSSSAAVAPSGTEGLGSQQFTGAEDWDFNSQFEGGDDTSGTTEIEGLPPPPAGVSASTAKTKGMDNYKQGQYADAIKWLSWAVILLGKSGDDAATVEVLSCRASCYKEVGEYKKAVADCTKVLEDNSSNVAVLVQRALLYESMEKYKLGAEDLRTVMKIDPGNRVARSTVHRLTKMAG